MRKKASVKNESDLDPIFENKEFIRVADHLIAIIQHELIVKRGEVSDGQKTLGIANKILERRIK